MITFSINITQDKYLVLKWIEKGCPDGMEHYQGFIRATKNFMNDGFVIHQYPKKPAYFLTGKGKHLIAILDDVFKFD